MPDLSSGDDEPTGKGLSCTFCPEPAVPCCSNCISDAFLRPSLGSRLPPALQAISPLSVSNPNIVSGSPTRKLAFGVYLVQGGPRHEVAASQHLYSSPPSVPPLFIFNVEELRLSVKPTLPNFSEEDDNVLS